jgi:hypothetical protein
LVLLGDNFAKLAHTQIYSGEPNWKNWWRELFCALSPEPPAVLRVGKAHPYMIGYAMSRSGLRSRAIIRMYAAIAAALSAALCWPVTSIASADYTDRALRTDAVELAQPKSRLSTVPATSAPIYNGYYGPVIRPASVFGGKW